MPVPQSRADLEHGDRIAADRSLPGDKLSCEGKMSAAQGIGDALSKERQTGGKGEPDMCREGLQHWYQANIDDEIIQYQHGSIAHA